ncbi:MAG: hypothetical protein CME61_01730 [Halobacteriovoraceae bacterium]|nr:hypothetical protein [Halobacteriovoraceae bacterium]
MRLLLLFSFLILPILGHTKKKIYKDKAIFRLSREVYFESDVKDIQGQLRSLDCIFGGSFLLDFLKKQKEPVASSLIQIKRYIEKKQYKISSNEYKKLIKKLYFQKCSVEKDKSWIKLLIMIEAFMQENFNLGTRDKIKKNWNTFKKVINSNYPIYYYE